MKNKAYLFIGSAALIIAFFIIGSSLYKKNQKEQYSFIAAESSKIFVRDYSPRYGDKNAKVFLVEFLDPECESCRMYYPEVKALLEEFKGKVQLVVRYAAFHGNSKIAIKALEAARKQNKYWESLELLFQKQPEWGSHQNPRPELIFTYLPSLGLDMDKLKKDMEDPAIEKIIEQDTEDLRTLNVRGTPTFFVNGMIPDGFGMPYLKQLISKEVQQAYQ